MNCPRCNTPLVPGRLAEHSIIERAHICETCKGSFLGPQALHEIEIQERSVFFELKHVPTPDEQEKPLNCPACGITMTKVVSDRDETVTMDYCTQCKHTWLDGGEIEAIETETLLDNLVALFRGPKH
ncbi:MAG: zf-TFIIB domain-containing protein [Byssovorax sp.]